MQLLGWGHGPRPCRHRSRHTIERHWEPTKKSCNNRDIFHLRERPATAICVLSLFNARALACPSWHIRSATVPSGIVHTKQSLKIECCFQIKNQNISKRCLHALQNEYAWQLVMSSKRRTGAATNESRINCCWSKNKIMCSWATACFCSWWNGAARCHHVVLFHSIRRHWFRVVGGILFCYWSCLWKHYYFLALATQLMEYERAILNAKMVVRNWIYIRIKLFLWIRNKNLHDRQIANWEKQKSINWIFDRNFNERGKKFFIEIKKYSEQRQM